ncbi:Protein-disulfide isomerase [Kosakonia arachidis]|uniref:Protein-disulfide isomerase n=1 Tax=Kosakonia arachidis TaxID=551989 RepID=A0A1I7AT13_9ENTR|nr:DsbA family protein [Kosakonia arachidis]SFT78038.1 Protein-disulfide isomerase [Kosakonia arachidis]
MKLNRIWSLVVTTYLLTALSPLHAAPAPVFTPEQEAQIGKIAADYLVQHPEILVEVSQKLQQQQQERQQAALTASVVENQAALLQDADTPSVGPAKAKVAVIEFFDYQCIYCSRLAPGLEQVMKSRPDVRYIFKEWPIFASKWEASSTAAQRGIDVWKQKGAEGYLKYHNAVYHTGHTEGELTTADIESAARAAGVTELKPVNYTAVLEKNDALAQALGLSGTPGLIVMPAQNATPKNITVFAGLASPQQILSAIQKAQN